MRDRAGVRWRIQLAAVLLFCQGMMGWEFAKTTWTDEEKIERIVSSDWKSRGQNVHACAEVMTSQRCAHNQVSRNRAWNW